MPKLPYRFLLIALLSAQIVLAQTTKQQERNLTAFAKLYGYTRYFYPGDEAQQINWDQLAVYGSKEIINAPNDVALVSKLKQLFLPIAPAIKIAQGKTPTSFNLKQIVPPDYKNLKVISWQHAGYYEGIRLNRQDQKVAKERQGIFDAMLFGDVAKFKGKKFILNYQIGVAKNWDGLSIKVIKDDDQMRLQLQSDQPIKDSLNNLYKVEGVIGPDIDKLILGFLNKMPITLSTHLFIEEDGKQTEVPLKPLRSYDDLSANEGIMRYGFVIQRQNEPDAPLFKTKIKIGEHIRKELVKDLQLTMPLAVYGNARHTYPKGNSMALAQLQKNIADSKSTGKNEQATYLADVIILWNVYQHFFDYWDDASKPPATLLHNALTKAATDKTEADIFFTLKLLNAALNDGHMFYNPPNVPGASHAASLPLVFTKTEGKIVVKFVLDSALVKQIHPGDVVDSIDHQDALAHYQNSLRYLPGSPQFKEFNALLFLANGQEHSSARLTLNRNGLKNIVTIKRDRPGLAYREGSFSPKAVNNGEIARGIFYYNLSDKAIDSVFNSHLNLLANSKGIILDLRGYPKSDIEPIIRYLMRTEENAKWMHIAQTIYPDHQNNTYSGFGWNLKPLQPFLNTKTYLLTDASAMSASDSYSGYFKDLKLATVVGQPTAGTNGQLVTIKLPGGREQFFSGMLVTNHNGGKHHINGTVPDVPVYPTIKGISEGRDEVLEKAIKLAETQ